MCEWCKDYKGAKRDLGPMYEDDTGWGPMYEHYYVEDEFAQWVEYQKKGRIRRWLKKMMDFHM